MPCETWQTATVSQQTVPEAWVHIASPSPRQPSPQGYQLDFVPAMGRLISAHPTIGAAFGSLFQQVMFAPGALTRAEREMVAGVAAAAQDCHY
jgi:alkylhydroperoxidase/carboxymuconolactone decarboxylase family protein YurZ